MAAFERIFFLETAFASFVCVTDFVFFALVLELTSTDAPMERNQTRLIGISTSSPT